MRRVSADEAGVNIPDHLLAKSTRDPTHPAPAERLQGHTAMVMAAAEEIVGAVGTSALAAARLPARWLERVATTTRLAAFAHDLGKASDHFQAMVRGERIVQLVRHEALSLWLCWFGQPLACWLRGAVQTDADYAIALAAAVGHHRKFAAHAIAPTDAGAGASTRLFTSHADFADVLRAGARVLGLTSPPSMTDQIVEDTRRQPLAARFEAWGDDANDLVPLATADALLLAIVKAMVLDADVAGSALPKQGANVHRWIAERLRRRANRGRLQAIAERRLDGHPPRAFQRAVGASDAPVTLATAGCGSGKTVAAYLWAAQHCGRQLWVTYPTTGTTTEGFRDYVNDADVVGRLEHGRALVDIELFELNDGDEGQRALDRLASIRGWGAEVVTATVDTVLGLVQNQRKGLYAFAGLAHAAVVFDEVHAYDDRLFGTLLRFLEALPGLPALLMTASLPVARLEALRALIARVHDRPLVEIGGPEDLEMLPRYEQLRTPDPWPAVRQCLEAGGKVLWVSNTVARCIDLARSAPAAPRPLLYHSRFRYCDRVERHGAVISAFQTHGPALALTTQVAEMSLDLSADLLVTDLAPVPALIQRLGRLNRRSTPAAPTPPRPFVVLPFEGNPYEHAALAAARAWLDELPDRALSQRDLVEAWKEEDSQPIERMPSEWLDGRLQTGVSAVRDASFGITVLRAEDASDVRAGVRKSVEVALPMGPPPGRDAWRTWPRVDFYPVPPPDAVLYDPLRGAQWAR
jgi:CRISPR-associated endonuclease/helicase Cas3